LGFGKLVYYVRTAGEAVLSTFGIRSFYEQPRYTVIESLGDDFEIRRYTSRLAVETVVEDPNSRAAQNQAFRLLLGYIAGANRGAVRLAMTAPVEQSSAPALIAMTAPVEIAAQQANRIRMRFFLPHALAANTAPEPSDERVRIVEVASATLAVLRFGGALSRQVEVQRTVELEDRLKRTRWRPADRPYLLAYDPPFTIAWLRRNEIAVEVMDSGEVTR
jgi:hypothetical protein